jgi:hypothetical protein
VTAVDPLAAAARAVEAERLAPIPAHRVLPAAPPPLREAPVVISTESAEVLAERRRLLLDDMPSDRAHRQRLRRTDERDDLRRLMPGCTPKEPRP